MKKFLVTVLTVCFVCGFAYSDDTVTTSVAQTKDAPSSPTDSSINKNSVVSIGEPESNVTQALGENSFYKKLQDNVELSYFGVYHGGSVNNPGNKYQPDIAGNDDPTSPQNLENYVTTGIKFSKDWMAGVSTHFFYNGSASDGPAPGQALGTGVEMLNPSLVLSKANLIDHNGFKIKGLLFAQLPVTSYDYISQPGRHMATVITPTFNMTYDFPKSRWSVGLYSYVAAYIPTENSPDGLRTYKIYSAPYLNYQATPTVAGTVWVDLLQTTRNQGTGFISGMNNPGTDIEPGVNWDVIPGRISLNPILNIYPGHATLASTSVQMVIIGKAL